MFSLNATAVLCSGRFIVENAAPPWMSCFSDYGDSSMQDWMRKHRRLIMFFVLIFICIPFIFMFGMPSGSNPRQAPVDNVVATVGGVPIMESEFR
ncbi:MAG TPA: SurA N-terminal domain-containing protein, partial [Candidatus Hydrogenedentes bacterium]|nr:SurA N-terminal domain-containing protein [Candidatus Hydrogenedentota bacterium]